jgi:hypothetical protein
MILTFELIDCIKQISLPDLGQPHPNRGRLEKKRKDALSPSKRDICMTALVF